MNAMDRALDRSMDAITRRAVRRMTFGKDAATILRIHELARDHRSHRAAMAFLSALRFPVQAPSQVPASEVGPDDERDDDFYDDNYLASLDAQAARAVDRAQRRGQKRHEPYGRETAHLSPQLHGLTRTVA